ncbi:MAG TPA: isochorismatase family protein [Noviherbaspirillum sp.]|jgi:nicotinamidase-related amidase|uniref:isochorismatase family protein n=1 Tax=Noviherbaspirillum sp. TaxID=1926288 RepID=UPI002F94D6E8
MNTLCDAQRSTLILIDLQARLMPAIHDGATVAANALRLASMAGMLGVPVVATVQNPEGLGSCVPDLAPFCGDAIAKTDFDATAAAGFLDALPPGRDELIVAGCEAHVCVLQTVLGLRRRGYHVRLAADAAGSRHPGNKAMALQRMQSAGAEPLTTEMVLFEWLRNSGHPRFRDMLQLIR